MSKTPQDAASAQAHEPTAHGHDEAANPDQPWTNVALAVFIAIFFCAGIYSAAHGLSEHAEGAASEHAGAEHAGAEHASPAHEHAAPEEKAGAPAEAPHEGK
jgi:hypothetical protein